MMSSSNDNEVMKRRRLDPPGVTAATDGAPDIQDDGVSRLEQRMESIEARFQREKGKVKRSADMELLAKNIITTLRAIEHQLSSLQDETDRLKAKISQLDEENRRLEAAFKLHAENSDRKIHVPDPPPASFWAVQDYDYGDDLVTDDDYTRRINEHFFQIVESQSKRLRRGTFGLQNDNEELYFGNPDEDATLIRYDDALLPHWVEFCIAMRKWQSSSIRGTIERTHPFRVYICNIELPAKVLQKLRECFMPGSLGHVEKFHLARNEFQGSDGIEFAHEIIQTNKKLTEICFERNPVDSDQDCQRLVDAIQRHPNISTCYLEGFCRGDKNGHDYLLNLLCKEGMKNVDFANCGVNTYGQSALFDIIMLHPSLVWLCLDENKLNDEDAIYLAHALQHNRTLETLLLKGNEFTSLGENVLTKVIYDGSTLNAIADSNHICTIKGLGIYHVEGQYNVYRNEGDGDDKTCPKSCRARKIFHLLEERNGEDTNVYFLESEMGRDTLKVVPLALAAVQTYGQQKAKRGGWEDNQGCCATMEDKAELSITYELMRSWHIYL